MGPVNAVNYLGKNALSLLTFESWRGNKDKVLIERAGRFFGVVKTLEKLKNATTPADKDIIIKGIVGEYKKELDKNGTFRDNSGKETVFYTLGVEKMEKLLRDYLDNVDSDELDKSVLGVDELQKSDCWKEPQKSYDSKLTRMFFNSGAVSVGGAVMSAALPPVGMTLWAVTSLAQGAVIGFGNYKITESRINADVEITEKDPSGEIQKLYELIQQAPNMNGEMTEQEKVNCVKHWMRIHDNYNHMIREASNFKVPPTTRKVWQKCSKLIEANSAIMSLLGTSPDLSQIDNEVKIKNLIRTNFTQLGINSLEGQNNRPLALNKKIV
jgi:hypothetical protein